MRIPGAESLKEKRHYVQSIVVRLPTKFRVAAAEVGSLDDISRAEIGVIAVSNEAAHLDSMLSRVAEFVERTWPELEILSLETEIIHAL
jgi:hypothetical protein